LMNVVSAGGNLPLSLVPPPRYWAEWGGIHGR
jgi:hypothetical protein